MEDESSVHPIPLNLKCKRCHHWGPNYGSEKEYCYVCVADLKDNCKECYDANIFPCMCHNNVDNICYYCGAPVGNDREAHYKAIAEYKGVDSRDNFHAYIIKLAEHGLFNHVKTNAPAIYLQQLDNLKRCYEVNRHLMQRIMGIPARFFDNDNKYDDNI